MKLKIIIYFLFVLVFENSAFSQKEYLTDVQREKIIIAQLDPKSKSVSKKFLEGTKKADVYMSTADNYYKQLEKYRLQLTDIKERKKRQKILKKAEKVEAKALESRVQSLDNYHEVAVRKYQIYKNDLKKFMKTSAKSKVDSAKVWEKQAYESFADAEIKVQIAYHTVNHGDLFDIYTQAYKLEQIGLLYQNKMYALFLAWEQADIERIDKEILAMQQNRPINNQLSEINLIDSIVYEKVVVYDTVRINKKNPELIYKIQIAASKKPLSIEQLRKIYHADDIINTVIEDDWYKYSVGIFETYYEAKKFKINIGVSDSFVVAYKKGERVQISDDVKNNTE